SEIGKKQQFFAEKPAHFHLRNYRQSASGKQRTSTTNRGRVRPVFPAGFEPFPLRIVGPSDVHWVDALSRFSWPKLPASAIGTGERCKRVACPTMFGSGLFAIVSL